LTAQKFEKERKDKVEQERKKMGEAKTDKKGKKGRDSAYTSDAYLVITRNSKTRPPATGNKELRRDSLSSMEGTW